MSNLTKPPHAPSSGRPAKASRKRGRSPFIDVLAVFSAIVSGPMTLGLSFLNLMLLAGRIMGAIPPATVPAEPPAELEFLGPGLFGAARFMAEHFQLMFFVALFFVAAQFVVSIGLLLRKPWARKGFQGLIVLYTVAMVTMFIALHWLLGSIAWPKSVPTLDIEMLQRQLAVPFMALVVGSVASGALVVYKLGTQAVMREFQATA